MNCQVSVYTKRYMHLSAFCAGRKVDSGRCPPKWNGVLGVYSAILNHDFKEIAPTNVAQVSTLQSSAACGFVRTWGCGDHAGGLRTVKQRFQG